MPDLTQWDSIVNELRGSCLSLEEVLEDHDAETLLDDMGFLKHLDGHIFQCTTCGWWFDHDDEASEEFGLEEWTCLECCRETAALG